MLSQTLPPPWLRFLRSRRLRRFIACGWVFIGLLTIALVGALAIAHFGFGVPVRDRDTGQPATAARLSWMILVGLAGGAFWLVLGVLLFRRSRDRTPAAPGA